jgi:hypothetical protein
MRLLVVLFTTILATAPAAAQQPPVSSGQEAGPVAQDTAPDANAGGGGFNLPVSLDKIRDGLQQTPVLSLRTLDERPIFRVQIRERQKIEELLASLTFKAGPTPAGGIYMQEQQRIMFNPVDHPLMQQYGAFSTGELLTILIENLAGKYLGGKMMDAVSNAERTRAEAAARDEVNAAVAQYCNAQPNAGAGLQICGNLHR